MALIYITGAPGSGKSTIQKELTKRGYEAYDIDEPRFGGPVNLITGKPTTVPAIEDRSPNWFDSHEWRVSRPAVSELKARSKDKTVYLCGVATTDRLVWDLFDQVLYLDIDEDTLKKRIANREDNDFGKTDDELKLILDRHKQMNNRMSELKVQHIEATQSIKNTIDQIVR